MKNAKYSLILLMIIVFMLQLFCSKKTEIPPDDKVLVKIGDKIITTKDFRYRAEFTPRLKLHIYNDSLHKNFVLNSLIAEKLFAIDVGKNSELKKRERFQNHIKGIKEQAMREELYDEVGIQKVKLDTNEIKHHYRVAGRQYDVEFYSIHNDSIAARMKMAIQNGEKDSVALFEEIGDKPFQWQVKWKDPDPFPIHDALFDKPVKVGQVLGPIKVDDEYYIIMRVKDWHDQPAIGPEDTQLRLYDVKEKLTQKHAVTNWNNYMAEVMEGKKIEFNKDTFYAMANIFASYYYNPHDTTTGFFDTKPWRFEEGKITFENLGDEEAILEYPFFTIDGKVWTVRDFQKELQTHPLVFRNTNFRNKRHFANEFRKAVADMIRDRYLTTKAYEKHIDKLPAIQRTAEMWEDAMVAVFERDKFIKNLPNRSDFNKDLLKGSHNYLEMHIDSLQAKYSDQIQINYKEFEKIKLTNIDLFVTKGNVPFPIAVPGFPQFTGDYVIDYGSELKE